MKKLLVLISTFLFILMTACFSFAASAPVIPAKQSALAMVWVNPNDVSDISKIDHLLFDGLKASLSQYPLQFSKDYAESQSTMQEYMIENGLTPNDIQTSTGFLPKKADMKTLAVQENVSYIAFINARITDKKEKYAWFSLAGTKYEVTTLFTVIVYSLDEDRYVYFNQTSIKENAAGTSSTERAFFKCCQKFLRSTLAPGSITFKPQTK